MGRRACFRFHRVAFGQDNETRPALNTPSPEVTGTHMAHSTRRSLEKLMRTAATRPPTTVVRSAASSALVKTVVAIPCALVSTL